MLAFAAEATFVDKVLSALRAAVGRRKVILILDDVHWAAGGPVQDLLTELVKRCPPGLTLVMAGRHELWSGLFRLKMDGRVTELTKEDLRFSREEAEQLWGFFDEEAYAATEGWPLALQSFLMAAEGGKVRLPQAHRKLHRYLLEEIFKQLSPDLQHFLLATAWLPELEAGHCDRLLGSESSQEILDELVRRNFFTAQTPSGTYRYHALFAAFLRQNSKTLGRDILRKAMLDCFARQDYERAAEYALLLEDAAFIHDCIAAALGRPFGRGRYQDLKAYFDCLEARQLELSPRVLLAKGLYLSSQGRFAEGEECLQAALPKLNGDRRLWLQVMVHKARILRHLASWEESSRLLDSLLPLPEDVAPEDRYLVMIEKIYNLTRSTRLAEALELTQAMLEQCAAGDNAKVRAWFERYLTVIHFCRGDYTKCLYYYERSLSLSEEEQDWLSRHSVGAFAAQAYQVTGHGEKALLLMEAELARLRRLGFQEELCFNYLMYAEMLLAEEMRKQRLGKPLDLAKFRRYLALGEEHAALKRTTGDHRLFAKILHVNAELLTGSGKAREGITRILALAGEASPFFRALAYGCVAGAMHLLGEDPERSKDYYRKAIAIGERHGTMHVPLLCYGELAALALREGDEIQGEEYARRFLELARHSGHRDCFRLNPLFGDVLRFALRRGIVPDFAGEMLAYGGYGAERVYINTLGTFYLAPVHDWRSRVRIRTKKSRELLAYLLAHREGVSREQIYADLWDDNEGNITGTFHTRRGEIRRAFESLGAKNPIVYEKGLYRLNMEEIVCDQDAFWQAAEVLLDSYREAGDRTRTVALLRRCTGLTYRGDEP